MELLDYDITGSLSGVVNYSGSPVSGAKVFLYWRATGGLIDFKVTPANGTFSFSTLDKLATEDYMIVTYAVTPSGFNAEVFDLLTAV
jgi:hypothetical protein